jgi:Zinc finger, C2H2 type
MTKEEIARIAKQQLVEITVNPSIKAEINVFSDINDENVVFKVPTKPVAAKRREVKRSPIQKSKLIHFKITSLPTRKTTSDGPEILQSSSFYKRKPIVTIRTLTQKEIDLQKVEAAAAASRETFVSSSGRIIKRKLPMTFPQLPFKPINIMKKTNIPFECDKCGEKLDSKLRLVSHLKNHRRGNKHQCPNCNRAFGNIAALKNHCATSHNDANPFKEKRFQCDLCPKKYMTDFLLGQHKLSHDNLKGQKCTECPFATNSPYDLKNHIKRIHNPTKDYECIEAGCGKTFKRRCDMENHRKSVHSKIRVYVKCPTCDVIVLEKGLQSHMINRHSEKAAKKPFVCTICGKAERYEKNLQRHYAAVHEPVDRGVTYTCNECPLAFFRRRDLTAHSFDHFQGILHTCQECGNRYKSKKELTNHVSFLKQSKTDAKSHGTFLPALLSSMQRMAVSYLQSCFSNKIWAVEAHKKTRQL